MKVQFTRELVITPAWGGNKDLPAAEQIRVKCKPLTTSQFFSILDDLDDSMKNDGGAADGDGKVDLDKVKARFESIGRLTMGATDILLDRITAIENLETGDGPVTPKEVLDNVFFFGLATEVLMSIIDLSRPNEDEVKN